MIFLQSLPAGDALYFSENIIHECEDAKALVNLGDIRHVIPNRSRLSLFEMIIYEGNEPFFSKRLDLEMMVWLSRR